MVRVSWVIACILPCLLANCSARSDNQREAPDASLETLRKQAKEKDRMTVWTVPPLPPAASSRGSFSSAFTPEAAAATSAEAVYPCIEGFGTTDTRQMTDAMRKVLDDFCTEAVQGKDVTRFMEEGMEAEAMFFMEDIKAWPKVLKSSPPIYGEVFINGEQAMVKVRLETDGMPSADGQHIDIEVCLSKENKITQLEILEGGYEVDPY